MSNIKWGIIAILAIFNIVSNKWSLRVITLVIIIGILEFWKGFKRRKGRFETMKYGK